MQALQARVAELEDEACSRRQALEKAEATAAAAKEQLAVAQRQHEARCAMLAGRMQAAETAAEAVLQQHSAQAGGPSAEAGGIGEAQYECRAAVDAIHAQVWRERLARQRAQAEALELRLRLEDFLEGAAVARAVEDEADEALMRSLEQVCDWGGRG